MKILIDCFCRTSLDNYVPDHSAISRFRSELIEKSVYEKIFQRIQQAANQAS
ncbi:transposase [Sphingobacterium cavernae]|uniref:transposase n=1 Tax=Sphingobacterium cavernae TaxID=2592657 RepID=UPI00122FBF83